MPDSRVEKAYRIYPILRHISPAMQADVLRNAQTRAKRKNIIWTVGRLSLLVVLLLLIGLMLLGAWLTFVGVARQTFNSVIVDVLGVLVLVGYLLGAIAAVWAVENAAYRSAMRTELQRTLLRRECYRCGYVLMGLTPVDGAVQCPECSHINASLITENSEVTPSQ